MHPKTALYIICYSFILVGGGVLVGAFWWIGGQYSFLQNAEKTQAELVDIITYSQKEDASFIPVYQFQDRHGKVHIVQYNGMKGGRPSDDIGDQVPILYLEGNPSQIEINRASNIWGGPCILGGMGMIFFLIGGIIIGKIKLRERRAAYLKIYGVPTQATVIDVEHVGNISVNGIHPYRIVCYWTDNLGEKIVGKSHYLWINPEPFISDKTVTVYFHQTKPKEYTVDTSFMPKEL